MAAIEVSKLWTQRGATDDLDNHRTYTREYEVITDDDEDEEQVVGNASVDGVTVPIPGDPLDSDPEAICVSVKPRQSDDSPRIWYVEVEYDTNPPTANERGADKPDNKVDLDGNAIEKGERQTNPLNEPAQWTLTFQDSEEPAIEGIEVNEAGNLIIVNPAAWNTNTAYKKGDYKKNGGNVYLCVTAGTSNAAPGGPAGNSDGIADGTCVWNFYATFAQTQNNPNFAIRTAILNSAWLPFDPPVMVPNGKAVLSVTKNVSMATLEYMLTLKNAVNITTWRGRLPRTAKVLNVTHDGGKEQNGVQYVTTKWEILIDPDTHDVRVLDAGFYERITYTTNTSPPVTVTDYAMIKDANDEPITSQVPLNGRGRRLKPDDPPVFKRYVPRQVRLIDFNTALPF